MKYARALSTSSVCSQCKSGSETTVVRSRSNRSKDRALRKQVQKKGNDSHVYNRIKTGLKNSNPAAIVLWAFHNLPSQRGLTSRRVIGFLKKHYKVKDNPKNTGKSLGNMIRCAVEFGLLTKRGNLYFLAPKTR
ncbi:hypothetical protein PYW07_012381 [Mythimna separata]|uniref:Uncharacterized protein n=1 Tax=Mythimna separata TaxID=271217 RepID=A0AAD7YM11_MYTSE|nr:hypothetical protein PYW07_012381 [Mythimna separata]